MTKLILDGLRAFLHDDTLDTDEDLWYPTVEELVDAATMIYGSFVTKIEEEAETVDSSLQDAVLLFAALVQLYLPSYRGMYVERETTEVDNTHT